MYGQVKDFNYEPQTESKTEISGASLCSSLFLGGQQHVTWFRKKGSKGFSYLTLTSDYPGHLQGGQLT